MEQEAIDTADDLAARVAFAMYERDAASRTLGMELLEVRAGFAKLGMLVRADMVNGHDICHGGLIFSLADSAFAFCCNSFNRVTVAAGATIDFLAPARKSDRLISTATVLWRAKRTGLYEVTVTKEDGSQIAAFRGRSYQLEGQVIPNG